MRDLAPETWNAADPSRCRAKRQREKKYRVDNFVNIHVMGKSYTPTPGSCILVRAWFDGNPCDDNSGFQFAVMNEFVVGWYDTYDEAVPFTAKLGARTNQSLMNRSRFATQKKFALASVQLCRAPSNLHNPAGVAINSIFIRLPQRRKSSESHKAAAWVEQGKSFPVFF